MIKTSISEEEDRLVMYFEGRLDTPDSLNVKKEMQVLFDSRDRNIVLDLTNLKYICSSGLRLFLALLQESRTTGNTVSVVGLSPYIRRVFDETGFTRLFKLD
jgi:anti-sigma B factor antagonist